MASLIRWDPFAELNTLHEQVNSLFNDTFGSVGGSLITPATDIYSDDKQLTLETHLPQFKEEEINIELNDNELEIKAEHQEKDEDKQRKYVVRESTSQYYRRFSLPQHSDTEHIKADFENGVLKVVVPFKDLPKPKRISIAEKSRKSLK